MKVIKVEVLDVGPKPFTLEGETGSSFQIIFWHVGVGVYGEIV